jgi:hypothetical protein
MSKLATQERPIIFSAPMVQSILSGSKQQTRRIVKPQPVKCGQHRWEMAGKNWSHAWDAGEYLGPIAHCPYGSVGDILWVREKCRIASATSGKNAWYSIDYAAGGSISQTGELPGKWFPSVSHNKDQSLRWKPSIHMPRWASRITLEITGVSMERLHDISLDDVRAEGVPDTAGDWPDRCPMENHEWDNKNFKEQWEWVWSSINGPDSWAANPWVWVVEFRRL